MITEYEHHPYANLFPMIEGDAFLELVDDIRANGLIEPIIIFEDKVLDGRNRQRAGIEAGVEVRTKEFEGTSEEALSFVFSMNIARRHLSDQQRAMIGAKIANIKHGGDRRSKQAAKSPVVTQKRASEIVNAPERSIRTAKAIIDHGIPELVEKVEHDEVSLSAGEALARREPGIQHEIVAAGNEAIVEHAAEAREPEPIPTDGWVAQAMKDISIDDSVRRFVHDKLESVAIEAIDAGRDDVVHDLGTALDILESLIGDVVEQFDDAALAAIAKA